MTIRSAVFVVLLGLWAGTGWAEHITHDGCNTCEQMGPSVYHCTAMLCVDQAEIQAFERKIEVHKNEDCLGKMEAAMRAMEEQFYYKSGGRMIFPFKHDGEPIRQLPGDVSPLIRQWDAVKRECWKQP